MNLFTNNDSFGGNLYGNIARDLRECNNAVIASAYVSYDVLKAFEPNIMRLARRGGRIDLIIGMAFFEGITGRTLTYLRSLHDDIRSIDERAGGVKLVWLRKFHGKIYQFQTGTGDRIYIGSSNFSASGLRDNLESTIFITDPRAIAPIKRYMDWLNNDECSAYIDKVEDISIVDSRAYQNSIERARLEPHEAQRYDISTIDLTGKDYIDISLSRNIDKKLKSNLNTYFGKGRWNRSTGHVIPRPWFEVEIIVDQKTTSRRLYPKGDFDAITDDGYTFPCETQSPSNNYKNLRSKNDLQILGKWIKMKLQNAGVLQPLTPVTMETLERYGKDYLRMYKLANRVYYLEF